MKFCMAVIIGVSGGLICMVISLEIGTSFTSSVGGALVASASISASFMENFK